MSDLPSCSTNVSKEKKQAKQFTWNRETTTDLINMYEAKPVLYVTALKEYKNKNKRIDAIRTITNELLLTYPVICRNITVDDVQKKIHGIRTQYLRELGNLKKFLSSGAPADAYIPKLWCFDLLGFLREGDPITQGESNLLEVHHENNTQENQDDSEEESNETVFEGTIDEINSFLLSPSSSTRASTPIIEDNVISNTPTTFLNKKICSNNKRKESSSVAALISTAAKTLEEHSKRKKLLNDNPALTEDEFDVFGKAIAMELRKIQDIQVLKTLKKKIYVLVIDAQ